MSFVLFLKNLVFVKLRGPALENRISKNLEVIQRYSKCLGEGNYEEKKLLMLQNCDGHLTLSFKHNIFFQNLLRLCVSSPRFNALHWGLSTSIRQPVGFISFSSFCINEGLVKHEPRRRLGKDIIFIIELSYKRIFLCRRSPRFGKRI